MRKADRQGGSVVTFVVVAIVLALLALGALFATKKLAMNDQTPPMVLPESSKDNSKESKNNQNDKAKEDDQTESTASESDKTDVDSEALGSFDDDSEGQDSGLSSDSEAYDQDLPKSGPDSAWAPAILAVVVTSGLAYARSLRYL